MSTSVPMGIVSLKAEGAYAADKLYKKGMWVTSSGSSYAYINPTPAAGVPLTDTSHWQQIASVGGQDILDAVTAEKNAAIAAKVLAEGYAAQLQAGIGSPAHWYPDLAAVKTANPAHDRTYGTENDGKLTYWSTIANDWVAGGVYQSMTDVVPLRAGALFEIENLVANPGFENDLTGWSNNGSVTGSVETTTILDGSKALKLTVAASSAEYFQAVPVPTGHIAYVAVWAYIESYTSGRIVLSTSDYTASTNIIDVDFDATKVGVWQLCAVLRTSSNNGMRIKLTTTTGTFTVIFDDAMVFDLTAIYGAGNEPGKDLFTRILANEYTHGWVSGVDKNFSSVRKLLLALKEASGEEATLKDKFDQRDRDINNLIASSDMANKRFNLAGLDGVIAPSYTIGSLIPATGAEAVNVQRIRSDYFQSAQDFTIKVMDSDYGWFLYSYDENKTFVNSTTGTTTLMVTANPIYYYRIVVSKIVLENVTDVQTYSDAIILVDGAVSAKPYQGKKVMRLGDSITARTDVRAWNYWFDAIVEPANVDSLAVSGAWWRDYSDTPAYDGVTFTGNLNVIGNQVQAVLDGSYDTPDYIIIAAGTNDTDYTVPTDAAIEGFFWSGGAQVSVDTVDRTTWVGAIRWAVDKLRDKFPGVAIFLTTPIQCVNDSYQIILAKNEIIKKVARRLSVEVIDTMECGVYDQYGTWGSPGGDFNDGLHLSQQGAQKMGRYVARKIINWFCY